MNELLKIKQSLKPFTNPDPETPGLVYHRLFLMHDLLMNHKAAYGQLAHLHQCLVYHNQSADVPGWLINLLPRLQNYLGVQMYCINTLIGGRIEPTKTIMVIGPKADTSLARHYISYLLDSVEAYVLNYKRSTELQAKKIRQEIREGIKDETSRLDDIRSLSSDYRHKIIEDIESGLEELLEDQNTNAKYRMAAFKSRNRKQELKAYMQRNPFKNGVRTN